RRFPTANRMAATISSPAWSCVRNSAGAARRASRCTCASDAGRGPAGESRCVLPSEILTSNPRRLAGGQGRPARAVSIGPGQHLFELVQELRPARPGAAVGLLLVRAEAGLLDAQARARGGRGQREG